MHQKNNHTRFKIVILLIVFVIALLVTFFLVLPIFQTDHYAEQKSIDLEHLSSSKYDSIFCSMYSIENFSREDLVTYRGTNTLKLENTLKNTADVGEYLRITFSSGNTIKCVFLGLDPIQIWHSSNENATDPILSVRNDILSYAATHPEVTFDILLSAPSLEYWLSESTAATEELLDIYYSLVCALEQHSNITVYYFGNLEWLIANPASYSEQATNTIVSKHLMISSVCDHRYQITSENAARQLDLLRNIITEERANPSVYPDLSSWDMVFFGDSIIGNYAGSSSVPGVVNGLAHARTYNCAKGGIPACDTPDAILSFPSSVDYFIGQNASQVPNVEPFRTALEEYTKDDHSHRNLCFVLNFGLNDYFNGHPIENTEDAYDTTSYTGALRVGISKLQNAYPDATILLMAPTFTTGFSHGTEVMSEKGGPLTEYVDAALQVADEMNILFMNNYTDLGIHADNAGEYMNDGTHLNEAGRFLLGRNIIRQIGSQ